MCRKKGKMMNEFLTKEHASWLANSLQKNTLSDIEVETEILAERLVDSVRDYGVDYTTMIRTLYGALESDSSRQIAKQNKVIESFIKRD